jgi:hypothetical protein
MEALSKRLKDLTDNDILQIDSSDLLQKALDYVIEHNNNENLKKELLNIYRRCHRAARPSSIATIWCVDDVLNIAKKEGVDTKVFTKDDAEQIMEVLKNYHYSDKSIGYDTICGLIQEWEIEFVGCIPEGELPLYMSTEWAWADDEYQTRMNNIKKED